MEIFCAEKVAVVEDRSNKTCRCGEKLELVRVIFDSPDRRYRSLVQMPVRRTHLAGIGYPFRRRPVGIEEAISASAGLGKHRRPSTWGWV